MEIWELLNELGLIVILLCLRVHTIMNTSSPAPIPPISVRVFTYTQTCEHTHMYSR